LDSAGLLVADDSDWPLAVGKELGARIVRRKFGSADGLCRSIRRVAAGEITWGFDELGSRGINLGLIHVLSPYPQINYESATVRMPLVYTDGMKSAPGCQ
jgi:hypothetical protein